MSNPLKIQKMGISNAGGYKSREALVAQIELLESKVELLMAEIAEGKSKVQTEKERAEMYSAWWREKSAENDALRAKLDIAKILVMVQNGEAIENPSSYL